jgi:DNA-binding GntR family transcriptional regulator
VPKAKKKPPVDIFTTLRDRIVSLEYEPGMPLNDTEIGKEFGVSRTPIREIIKKLEQMGLVTVLPRYSTRVSQIDINEIRWAFEVRLRLDGMAGAEAAQKIPEERLAEMKQIIDKLNQLDKNGPKNKRKISALHAEFHAILYEATGNPLLREILDNLHSRCARACNAFLGHQHHSLADLDQVQAMYDALAQKDAEKAARLCQAHVQSVIDRLKTAIL